MPKQKITIKLDDHALAIVNQYQRDHSCDRTKAISQIIRAYPLHMMKLETKKLAGQLDKDDLKESVMPDICKHITEYNIEKDKVMCAHLNRYVTADQCQTCPRRKPVKETDP